jgi:hypothetical protein
VGVGDNRRSCWASSDRRVLAWRPGAVSLGRVVAGTFFGGTVGCSGLGAGDPTTRGNHIVGDHRHLRCLSSLPQWRSGLTCSRSTAFWRIPRAAWALIRFRSPVDEIRAARSRGLSTWGLMARINIGGGGTRVPLVSIQRSV